MQGSAHNYLGRERQPLDALFAPRQLLVLSDSQPPATVAPLWQHLHTAVEHGVAVTVVAPAGFPHTSLPRVATLSDAPNAVDLAIVAKPIASAAALHALLHELVAHAVASVMVLKGTVDGVVEPAGLRQLARDHNIRLLGPGTVGWQRPQLGLHLTTHAATAHSGSVAFLTQSGALGAAVLAWSQQEQVGFSALVSVGALADLDWGDLITYFGEDPATKSIVVYMEDVGTARRFQSATREVALTKPIIVLFAEDVGQNERVAVAPFAISQRAVMQAAFRRCGAVAATQVVDLFNLAELLSKVRRPRGFRLAIVTNATSPGQIAQHTLRENGGETAVFNDNTLSQLAVQGQTISYGIVDLDQAADAAALTQVLDTLSADDAHDGLLVIWAPTDATTFSDAATALVDFKSAYRRPLLACWMGSAASETAVLNDGGVATFDYPDAAARLFCELAQYGATLRSLYETPAPVDLARAATLRSAVAETLRQQRDAQAETVPAAVATQILQSYAAFPPMVTTVAPTDYQLTLGIAWDPSFGPLLFFGSGGPFADVLQDRTIGLPPLNRTLAQRMMEGTYAWRHWLTQQSETIREELEQLLVRIGDLALNHQEIQQVELHLAVAQRLASVRPPLVRLHPASITLEQLPPPAIRPYPAEYTSRATLRDGSDVVIRPIRPEDEPLLVTFHGELGEQSVYFRYFRSLNLSHRIAHERLTRLCFIDYDRDMALVALRTNDAGQDELIGVGRLSGERHTREAEFAIVVADRFQRTGLGTILLRRLVEIGDAEGLERITAYMLPTNRGMRTVSERLGFTFAFRDGMIFAERPHGG